MEKIIEEGKQLVDVAREALDIPEEGDDDNKEEDLNTQHKTFLEKIQGALSERVEAVNVSRRLPNYHL